MWGDIGFEEITKLLVGVVLEGRVAGETVIVELEEGAVLIEHFEGEFADDLVIHQVDVDGMLFLRIVDEIPIFDCADLRLIAGPLLEHVVPINNEFLVRRPAKQRLHPSHRYLLIIYGRQISIRNSEFAKRKLRGWHLDVIVGWCGGGLQCEFEFDYNLASVGVKTQQVKVADSQREMVVLVESDE